MIVRTKIEKTVTPSDVPLIIVLMCKFHMNLCDADAIIIG